tara:strand:- start:204 stop:551 length:348 start_codon:yes stop_codon:yes gene_type:complete
MITKRHFKAPTSTLSKISRLVCEEMSRQRKGSNQIIREIDTLRSDIPNLAGTLMAVKEGHNTSWPTGHIQESRVENFLLGLSYILKVLEVPANQMYVNKLRMSPYAIDYFLYPPR